MSETVWKFSIAIYLKCDELTCLFINSIETEWIGGEDECECNRTASDGLSRSSCTLQTIIVSKVNHETFVSDRRQNYKNKNDLL